MRQISLLYLLLLPFLIEAQEYQKTNEKVQLEFKTTRGKKLVIAVGENEEYLVYRYGTENKIELQYPEELENSWSAFQYSWYSRGGGIQNEGMALDYLYFDKGNYRYVVFQEYLARTETIEYGIYVINLSTKKKTIIKAEPISIKGSLSVFRDMGRIKKGEELFK